MNTGLSKFAQIHLDFKDLSDVTLVAGNGEQAIIHPTMLAVVSEFLRTLMLEHSKSQTNLVIVLPDMSFTEVNELLEMLVQKDISETNVFNMLFVNHNQTEETNLEYQCTNEDSISIDKMFVKTNIEVDQHFLENQINSKTIRNEHVNSYNNIQCNDNIFITRSIEYEELFSLNKERDKTLVNEFEKQIINLKSNEDGNMKTFETFESFHDEQGNEIACINANVITVSKNVSDEEIICPYCSKIFKTNKRMECHLTLTHESKKEYFQYMTKRENNDWVCQLCFRTFNNEKGCTRHLLSLHKMGKKYECKVCTKSSVGKYNFEIHMASHKNVPGVCDLCGLELAEKRYLKKHHQKMHASEEEKNLLRIHACQTCPKTFYSRATLTSHEYLHTDSYNFICAKCNSSFKTDNGLRTHKNVKHLGKVQKQSTRDKHNARTKEIRKEQKIRNGGVLRVGEERLKFNEYMRKWTQKKKLKGRVIKTVE